MPEVMKVVRGFFVVVMIVIYVVLVHHVNTSGQVGTLGAMLALTPIFLVTFTLANKPALRLLGISLLLIFCIIAWLAWSLIKQHTGLIFWLQDVGLMLVLLITFGRTLRQNHKPLCVHFAEMINAGVVLPPEHERYARKVTVAWVLFFAMIIVISTLLFFLTPLATWSIFVNFLTLPLVALMFIGEFMMRRHILADLPAGNLLDAVRAYLNNSARMR